MFNLQTVNELSLFAQGQGLMYAKKGAMIAYQGHFKFEKLLIGPGKNLASAIISNIARRLTGEYMELMKVTGQGNCFFAELAKHVTVINLNPGESIGVESENLLAFTDTCDYGVRPIGVGVISQKGLFTSKLTGKGPNAQVAVLSDGNPLVLDSPCCVDPDAVICWTGPDPGFKLDLNWKTFIGQTSGESYMLEFKNPGQKVLVQPSERESGLKIGIDDKRYRPDTQSSAFQNTRQNLQNTFGSFNSNQNQSFSSNQGFGGNQGFGSSGSAGSGGGIGNLLGNILSGRF
ncbi:MAG TPA: AIM24 family protein [Ruminiclostridium sp.]|uniref:Tryptophan RNA-binding attenuation protein n=1 Tax=Acetivibrio saccincola TaxID=1677857 RepID=A0A2S8RAM2_9FIRM|nr:tryptophan RNA-binding attenuation protein [Acetivibrio saccincola]HAA43026.1 AIM24 family protein [Ruminiclostridium sp.]